MSGFASPPLQGRVLVVGTTPDYIAWIRRARPLRALFLTDRQLRERSTEDVPVSEEEILCKLDDPQRLYHKIQDHLARHGIDLAAIICFDCECLKLTAELAALLNLPYPSVDTILRCRDKFQTKQRWTSLGVPCPSFAMVDTLDDVSNFMEKLQAPLVMKPLSGSGSELTFRCDKPQALPGLFMRIQEGLGDRREVPMYSAVCGGDRGILAEEWVVGVEYSADFIVENDDVAIVRLCRKHSLGGGPFGIARSYELLDEESSPFRTDELRVHLAKAATSLGLEHSWCMADFFEQDGHPVFLELTPRPGGDCLPWLLRTVAGVDTIGLAVDFALGGSGFVHGKAGGRRVGLRLFANQNGKIRGIDTERLATDARVLEVYLKRSPGDVVRLPPVDYDTWILGHVIYAPDEHSPIGEQDDELTKLLRVEWEN